MDHLRAHEAASVREAIEARGAVLRYLPQYSPDLNPIEMPLAERTIPRLRISCKARLRLQFLPQQFILPRELHSLGLGIHSLKIVIVLFHQRGKSPQRSVTSPRSQPSATTLGAI
jgi:transposase